MEKYRDEEQWISVDYSDEEQQDYSDEEQQAIHLNEANCFNIQDKRLAQ